MEARRDVERKHEMLNCCKRLRQVQMTEMNQPILGDCVTMKDNKKLEGGRRRDAGHAYLTLLKLTKLVINQKCN